MPTRTQTAHRGRHTTRSGATRRQTTPRSSGARITIRRKPEPSAAQKALQGLKGAVPTGVAARATPSSKKGKTAGLAALAGAAGLAISQRNKLKGLFSRHDGAQRATPGPGPEAVDIPGRTTGTTTGGLDAAPDGGVTATGTTGAAPETAG